MNKNNFQCHVLVLLLLFVGPVMAQAKPSKRRQFETKRTALLRRIQNIRQVLKKNASRKKNSMGQLKALNKQIESNALLIQTMSREIGVLHQEMQQKQAAMGRLTQDLEQLEREYATMVYVGSKTLHDIHQLMFILATPSFHQLVQRLQHVKQYARTRKQHLEEIKKVKDLLQAQHLAATQRQQAQRALLQTRKAERTKLRRLQARQTRLVRRLARQHRKLNKELAQRNQAVKRLDKLIGKLIRQQRRTRRAPPAAGKAPPLQPGDDQLTVLFRKSRGKLPWPVAKGFISGQFGIGPHPVLKQVQIENLGIDIQTQPGAQVQALCPGVVKAVALVPGMHRVVIVQHGAYHTVYAKLQRTTVKVGQQVQAHTPLGTVATDAQGTTELQLQVWYRTQKLNPAVWLRPQ